MPQFIIFKFQIQNITRNTIGVFLNFSELDFILLFAGEASERTGTYIATTNYFLCHILIRVSSGDVRFVCSNFKVVLFVTQSM